MITWLRSGVEEGPGADDLAELALADGLLQDEMRAGELPARVGLEERRSNVYKEQ